MDATLVLGQQGRLVIPAELRAAVAAGVSRSRSLVEELLAERRPGAASQ